MVQTSLEIVESMLSDLSPMQQDMVRRTINRNIKGNLSLIDLAKQAIKEVK